MSSTTNLTLTLTLTLIAGELNYKDVIEDEFSVGIWFFIEGMGTTANNIAPIVNFGETFDVRYNCFGQLEVQLNLDGKGPHPVDANAYQEGVELPKRRWHFLLVSAENLEGGLSRVRIDVNGKVVSNRLFDSHFRLTGKDTYTRIGNNDDGDAPFEGKIDDYAVWNRALTIEEADHLYHVRDGIPDYTDPGLLTVWNFDFEPGTDLEFNVAIQSRVRLPAMYDSRHVKNSYGGKIEADKGLRLRISTKGVMPFPSRQVRDTAMRRIVTGGIKASAGRE